jgi:hypothetical protein
MKKVRNTVQHRGTFKMKALTAPQKRILDREGEDCIDVDELPSEVFEELMRLNNHELMVQAANRYLSDKAMERMATRQRW